MQIYQLHSTNLKPLKEQSFALEKDLQKIFEANLFQLTKLRLVKSEFQLQQYRFDTLAFDDEKKAFVIIEYKRNKNHSVIDQGVSYLGALLDYKDSALMEFNERFPNDLLKRSSIDWSQTRILFVTNAFTDFQIQATNFSNLGINLAEFKCYENGLFSLNFIQPNASQTKLNLEATTTTKSLPFETADTSALEKITTEIKTYDEAFHLSQKSDAFIEMYETFRDAILNLDAELELVYTKIYIAFKKDKTNCVDIAILKNSLKIWLNAPWGALNDSLHLFRNVNQIGHHGNGDYELSLTNLDHLEYILSVIKQAIQHQSQ